MMNAGDVEFVCQRKELAIHHTSTNDEEFCRRVLINKLDGFRYRVNNFDTFGGELRVIGQNDIASIRQWTFRKGKVSTFSHQYRMPGCDFFEMLEVGGNNNPTHWAGKIRYSRPDMNRFYGYELNEEHSPKPTVPEHEGDWRFITYSWGETVVAGLEDTGDDDMNDLLFSVKANITNKPKDINPDTPTTQKWLVACEDLGGSFDYDFNDIVLGFEKRDVKCKFQTVEFKDESIFVLLISF